MNIISLYCVFSSCIQHIRTYEFKCFYVSQVELGFLTLIKFNNKISFNQFSGKLCFCCSTVFDMSDRFYIYCTGKSYLTCVHSCACHQADGKLADMYIVVLNSVMLKVRAVFIECRHQYITDFGTLKPQ